MNVQDLFWTSIFLVGLLILVRFAHPVVELTVTLSTGESPVRSWHPWCLWEGLRKTDHFTQTLAHARFGWISLLIYNNIITFPTRVTSSIMITVLQLSSCELWLSGLISVQVPTWGIILVSNAIPFVEMLEKFRSKSGERYLNKQPDIVFWKLERLHIFNINC